MAWRSVAVILRIWPMLTLLFAVSWAEDAPVREAWSRFQDPIKHGFTTAYDVALDRSGNAAVLGFDHGTCLSWYASEDGRAGWTKFFASVDAGVAMDPAGNVVISGVIARRKSRLEATIKYRPDGRMFWRRALSARIDAMTVDREGNVIISGERHPRDGLFTAKLAGRDGEVVWYTRHVGFSGGFTRIGVSRSGDVAVTFSSHSLDVFKLSGETGHILWERRGRAGVFAQMIALDAAGNVIVARDDFYLGPATDRPTQVYVSKYASANGATLWESRARPHYYNGILDAALDLSGNLFVLSENNYLVKFASADGRKLWERDQEYISTDYFDERTPATDLALDDTGNPIAVGRGVEDERVVTEKYSGQTGETLWKRTFDGQYDEARAVAAGSGMVVTTGNSDEGRTSAGFFTVKYVDGPTVWTQPAYGVSSHHAGLRATVNPNGVTTKVAFEFSTDPKLKPSQISESIEIGDGSGPVPIDIPVFNLSPDTTYYFRVVGIVGEPVNRGETLNFKTAP